MSGDDELDPDFADDDDAIETSPPHSTASADEPPRLRYASVYEFVGEHLTDLYRRDVSGDRMRWCPWWWAHAEAVSRLEAMWRAWEHLRLDGSTGMSVWWRDHADPAMHALLDPQGPFDGCSAADGHRPRLDRLPSEPLPDMLADWLMSDPACRTAHPPT